MKVRDSWVGGFTILANKGAQRQTESTNEEKVEWRF